MSVHNCDYRTVLKLRNRFDYREYLAVCAECGCIPEQMHSFCATAGRLSVAENLYPDMPVDLAYMNIIGGQVQPVEVDASSRGLGDTVAKVTGLLGIKPCGGCEQRREWLNERFPYGGKP